MLCTQSAQIVYTHIAHRVIHPKPGKSGIKRHSADPCARMHPPFCKPNELCITCALCLTSLNLVSLDGRELITETVVWHKDSNWSTGWGEKKKHCPCMAKLKTIWVLFFVGACSTKTFQFSDLTALKTVSWGPKPAAHPSRGAIGSKHIHVKECHQNPKGKKFNYMVTTFKSKILWVGKKTPATHIW